LRRARVVDKRPNCPTAGAEATSLMVLPGRPIIHEAAEVQVYLRRVRSPPE